VREVDELLRRMAGGRRHGAVRHGELVAAGVTERMIELRLESGFLLRAHRGVYVVNGPERPPLADHAAAVLACRPRALLSHRTILRLRGLPVRPDRVIDVTVVGHTRRPPGPGVRTHSISQLLGAERTFHEGIPATSSALALLDVAGYGDADELLACLHEARVQKLVTDRQLHATLTAHPSRRGARALRRLLAGERGVKRTRSETERRILRVLRAHGLEPDLTDHRIGPYTLDFYFSAERVALEYDSRRFHDNPQRFISDRRKIAYLAARGILTVPLTDPDLGARADRAMADLRATLASRRG
jgi:very-short-patch-repair endonuclease